MGDLLRIGLSNALCAAAMACVVALAVLPLRRRRPAAVHALWLLVLLKLVTPPLWQIPVDWPAPPPDRSPAAPAGYADLEDAEVFYVDEVEAETAATPAPGATPAPAATPADWVNVIAGAAGLAWVAGSAVFLSLTAWRSLQFRRLLRLAEPAPHAVARRVGEIARRFEVRAVPDVCFVPGAVCPMLFALGGRGRLLLPRGLWERLDERERDTLVAHELAHLRRGDHRVRLVEVAATVLYWWNPVLWWARRELREAEEQCCDAWVVWSMPAAARHYMSAIVEAVDFVSEPQAGGARRSAPAAVPALASGMGEFRRLERRLRMIRRNESPRRLGPAGTLAVVLAAGAALPLAPTLAVQEDVTPAAEPQQHEHRTIIVTPSPRSAPATDPASTSPAATDPAADAAPASTAPATDALIEADVSFDFVAEAQTTESPAVLFEARDDAAVERRVDTRTGQVIEVQGKTLRVRAATDLEQARAEVERARADLAAAEHRLRKIEAEARAGGDKAEGMASKPVQVTGKRSVVVSRRAPAATTFRAAKRDANKKQPAEDQAKRMDELEQKLEQMNDLLRRMLDTQERERGKAGDDNPYGPAAGSMRSY